MRTPFYLIVTLILFASAASIPANDVWVIDSASQLIIHGYTNVNEFQCTLENYHGRDTLVFEKRNDARDFIFTRNQMTVPVHDFDCENNLITRDFLETVQAEKYPYIKIQLLSLSMKNGSIYSAAQINGRVAITLAGITRQYDLTYKVEEATAKSIRLKGAQAICFADYRLKTPKKMFGLIQVQEDLNVEFILHMRPL